MAAEDFNSFRSRMQNVAERSQARKGLEEAFTSGYFSKSSNLEPEPQNPRPADKGECGGECERTACRNKGIVVHWWNTGTQKWYCQPCAFRINSTNPDLCLKRLTEAEAKQPNPENPCES